MLLVSACKPKAKLESEPGEGPVDRVEKIRSSESLFASIGRPEASAIIASESREASEDPETQTLVQVIRSSDCKLSHTPYSEIPDFGRQLEGGISVGGEKCPIKIKVTVNFINNPARSIDKFSVESLVKISSKDLLEKQDISALDFKGEGIRIRQAPTRISGRFNGAGSIVSMKYGEMAVRVSTRWELHEAFKAVDYEKNIAVELSSDKFNSVLKASIKSKKGYDTRIFLLNESEISESDFWHYLSLVGASAAIGAEAG